MHKTSTSHPRFDTRVLERLEQSIASIKALYHKKLIEVCVFGSHAKGTSKRFSSLDLLVVVQESDQRFLRRNAQLHKILDEDNPIPQIDPLVYTHDELIEMIHKKESFILSMLRESILVWSKDAKVSLSHISNEHYHRSRYSVAIPELKDPEKD